MKRYPLGYLLEVNCYKQLSGGEIGSCGLHYVAISLIYTWIQITFVSDVKVWSVWVAHLEEINPEILS